MAEEIRVNRPAPQVRPEAASEQPTARPSSRLPWIVLVVIVVVLVVLGVLFREKLFGGKSKASYQAVFLTNGQVYFGKLGKSGGGYTRMSDIYYLQVGPQQGSTQPGGQGTEQNGATTTPQQTISLVKLGNELHGPVDSMSINRDHILFFEDLKDDGEVVKAIKQHKANPQGNQAPQQ